MTSYIIAGSSDNDLTTKCEFLSVQVKENFHNIDFRVIIKDPKQWDSHIRDICRTYGFKVKENPIIFKSNGTLIGNTRDFENYCENNFGISGLQNSLLKSDTNINKKIAKKEYKLKKKLEMNKKTLTEKITLKLEETLRSNLIKITEGFYKEVTNSGITFFVKQEKNIQPIIKIPLKIANPIQPIKENDEDFNPEEAAKKDFVHEIIADPSAFDQQSPETKVEGEKSPKFKLEGEIRDIKEGEIKGDNEKKEILEGENKEIEIDLFGSTENDKEKEKSKEQEINKKKQVIQEEKLAMEEPKSQDYSIGDYVIENIKDDYYLALNPEPLINGQCMIFQDRRDCGIGKLEISKTSNNPTVIFKDYSKSMKNRRNNEIVLNFDKEKSALNDKFLNIYEPLSVIDWSKALKVIKKTDSYAFIQIMPFNSKNFINFLNNTIHVIPRRFLLSAKNNKDFFSEEKNFFNLPFENYWSSTKKEYVVEKKFLPDLKFYKYENFKFSHLFGQLKEKSVGKDLHNLYLEMVCFLKERNHIDVENCGINIVINKEYLFLAPIQKPILKYNGIYDLFLPPFSYLGYIHKPLLKFVWPDTVSERTIFNDSDKILEILMKSAEVSIN